MTENFDSFIYKANVEQFKMSLVSVAILQLSYQSHVKKANLLFGKG